MAAIAPRPLSPEREPLVGNYFVAAYPPFSCWESGQVPALSEALNQPAPAAPLGLYVHVPFCQQKCSYCYYLSFVGQPAQVIDRYVDRVVAELSCYALHQAVARRRLAFVYFGGGTPSLLTSQQVRRLAAGLKHALPWTGGPEVTFECAPRSVRADFLDTLRDVGVTRLSMGVQSFDDRLLKANGRVHLRADVLRAWSMIEPANFDWVNLDLMCGLLGETDEIWRDTVQQAIQLNPASITIYQTEMPHNTRLYRDFKAGALPAEPAPWSVKRARLDDAFAQLDRAGYSVVSAYNAVRDPARHQFQYQEHLWHGGDMLGLGVAAFGYVGGVHYQNEVTLPEYEEAVGRGMIPAGRAFALTDRERLVREFILQLKLGGAKAGYFKEKFGVDLTELLSRPLRELRAEGMLTLDATGVRLKGEGQLRVDWLLPRFYDARYRDIRYT